MRTSLIILLVLAAIVAAGAAYLVATTPHTAVPVSLPLTAAQRELLSHVPESADSFALLPRVVVLHASLLANPLTRETVERWTESQPLPHAWLLGGADAVIWREEKQTGYAIRLDGVRSVVAHLWMSLVSTADARWENRILLINAPEGEPPMAREAIDSVLALAGTAGRGDVLVVQQTNSRGAFPPIGRPALSFVTVSGREITIDARARSTDVAGVAMTRTRFPRGAMLTVSFASAPKAVGDLGRLFGASIDDLVRNGGAIAFYDIETGGLLPRPKGVIAVPADERARNVLPAFQRVVDAFGETREAGDQLLVAFDRQSVGRYVADQLEPAFWPANRWAMRIDPVRLVPVLQKVGRNTALRYATPRIYRSARDLDSWIGTLERAREIEAADSVGAGIEELRVRIEAK